MPELPEVETIGRAMERAMIGKTFDSIKVHRYDLRIPIPENIATIMKDTRLNAISRRGKYLILNLSNSVNIILHLGMSGRIHIFNEKRPAKKHEHVHMIMDDGILVAFEDPRRFGMFYILNNWQKEKPFSNMGPEPLGNECSGQILFEHLNNKKTPIKNALLDQRIIAGLGNIYVCEALYRANLHPQMPSHNISSYQSETLMTHIRAVLNEAIASGGSSLKDYRHTDGSLGYFQHGFKVYDREGQKCMSKTCDNNIVRIIQSGRSTFFCPSCQSDRMGV